MKFDIPELVEIPDEVEDALKLLNIESDDDRRFLGIHGMGGMGKTTLAKVVFNQISDSFNCSCFLENVRDGLSQGPDALPQMQEKLLKSLNPSLRDVIHPMEILKKSFTSKKVIIVLDDIEEKGQIHSLVGDSGWFGLGSRIIFTTRKANLHEQVISSIATFHDLEKSEMTPKQALELFSKHAFGQDSPSEDFKVLSNKVISVTGRLPLALEVVGSFLCRKKAKVWISTIKKLKEAPVQDVQRKLRLSYDALEPEQQEIFLDIACFFIGKDKKNAVYMWEACDFCPDHGIEVLISMSLIKITHWYPPYLYMGRVHEKRFWMHDQLRDLGRAIVNEKCGDPRAGSRLWVAEDALDQLRRNSGKERVDAVQLIKGPTGTITLDREDFIDLKRLRFLKMSRITNVSEDFSDLLPKLRWLSLSHMSFNATNLCLKELAVLELRRCSFEVNCHGLSQFLMSEKLKALTISECEELTSMPDLSKLVNLERLVFSHCKNRTSIHSSLWKLRYLKHLSLGGLNFTGDRRMPVFHCNLPESIGHLECLTTLILSRVDLTKLPKDIGELVKLKHMSLYGCSALKVIPESIENLRSLVSLNLSQSGITELPSTIGRLTKLESLNLSWCSSLHSLPNSMGNLRSLNDLQLYCSGITELPNSIGDLASLQVLNFGNTTIDYVHELPIGLRRLTTGGVQKMQLSNFSLSHLEVDTGIFQSSDQPMVIEGIEKLSKLERLRIRTSRVQSLSMELNALQHLTSLKLDCQNLEFGLCQLPSSLESLKVKVKDWGELLLNLPSLKNLSKLKLINCGADEAEGRMEHEAGYAKSVSMDMSALQKLKSLKLVHSKLEFGQCQLPSSLETLELKVKDWGELLLNLPNLKNLSSLSLTSTFVEPSYQHCSTNPNYHKAIDFIFEQARTLALEPQTFEFVNRKPVIILKWPGKDVSLPSIMLYSHTDGRIYGRGSRDMKCMGMQYLEAIRNLKSSGFEPLRTVYVVFVADGAQKLAKSKVFKKMNVAVVLDEGLASVNENYRVFSAERSPWYLKIKARGAPRYGEKLCNYRAMENLLKSIESVRKFRASQFDLVKAGLKAEGGVVSVNMACLEAGDPLRYWLLRKAEAGFQVLVPPTADPVALERMIAEEWAPVSRSMLFKFKPKGSVYHKHGKPKLWWAMLEEAVKKANGKLGNPEIFPAPTDARYFRLVGLPVIGFSPVANTPSDNEFIDRAEYLKGIEVYESIIKTYSTYVDPSREEERTADVAESSNRFGIGEL